MHGSQQQPKTHRTPGSLLLVALCALLAGVGCAEAEAPLDTPLGPPPPPLPEKPPAPETGPLPAPNGKAPGVASPPPADPCAGLGFEGRCEGDLAVWCEAGDVRSVDCAAYGTRCAFIDPTTGYYCEAQAPEAAPGPEDPMTPAPDPQPPGADPTPDPAPAPDEQPAPGPGKIPDGNADPSPSPSPDPSPSPSPDPVPERQPDPGGPMPGGDCGSEGYEGRCEGDVAVWCDDGRIARFDCRVRLGVGCGFVGADTGYFCRRDDAPPPGDQPQPQPQPQPGPSPEPEPEPQPPPGPENEPQPPAAEPEPEPAPDDACGDLDYLGRCDGDIAQWCQDGRVQAYDCGNQGQTCGYIDNVLGYYCRDAQGQPEPEPEPEPEAEPPAAGCGGINFQGECQGDVAVWCNDGALEQQDCGAMGQVCGWAGDALGHYCIDAGAPEPQPEPEPQPDGCGGVDYLGECQGDVAVWCGNGALQQLDCAGLGQICGWVDEATGYYCQ